MSEQSSHSETHEWEHLPPGKVLEMVVFELYNPVSLLGSQLNRLTAEDDPMTEEEYEAIFEQMQAAVRQLSKTVVSLKRYARLRFPDAPLDDDD
jgi:hypothetical protein